MFRKVLTWILVVYVLSGALLYFFQKKLIFHPIVVAADQAYHFDVPFQEMNVRVNDKTTINAILFKAAQPARGIVVYFHGNAQNVSYYAYASQYFTKHGYEVLMMDYPGYGKSTGTLTEEDFYADALQMYQVARTHFSPDSIIIYGRSLGTGIAAQLASVRDCKRLVLEAPYYNLTDMAMKMAPIYPYGFMLNFKFPTNEYLPNVTAPITIIHGTDDRTVPYESGLKLKEFFKKSDSFITISGAGHNNLKEYPLFGKTLEGLVK